jgi:phosphoglucosamine mutase
MERLFGTDGVRGRAGEYPLDCPTIQRLGASLARAMGSDTGNVRFLSGRDTRESGPWIEEQLAAGIRSQGGTLVSAGVIPTPAIAHLTPRMGYTAGVVISASHNPFEDNGIKVFSGTGAKFTEALEGHVESFMADASWTLPNSVPPFPAPDASAWLAESHGSRGAGSRGVDRIDYRSEYIEHLLGIFQPDARYKGTRIAIDCANGATTSVAPGLFERLGFEVRCIGCEPDGRNINLGCGSTVAGPRLRNCWHGRS